MPHGMEGSGAEPGLPRRLAWEEGFRAGPIRAPLEGLGQRRSSLAGVDHEGFWYGPVDGAEFAVGGRVEDFDVGVPCPVDLAHVRGLPFDGPAAPWQLDGVAWSEAFRPAWVLHARDRAGWPRRVKEAAVFAGSARALRGGRMCLAVPAMDDLGHGRAVRRPARRRGGGVA